MSVDRRAKSNRANESNEVDCEQLLSMVRHRGSTHRVTGQSQGHKVMTGQFAFANFPSGIHVHGSDAVETGDLSSSTQLPACLSFNVLLQGTVDFTLSNRRLQISTMDEGKPVCAVSVLSRPDLMTRQVCVGRKVKKVNVFVERSWLEMRCQDEAAERLVALIFSGHARLYQWSDDPESIALAESILEAQQHNSLSKRLKIEHMALALLSRALDVLPDKIAQAVQEHEDGIQSNSASQQRWQDRAQSVIRQNIARREYSIGNLAQTLGTSVSTLQRRFKSCFGMTVAEFIRIERLEQAKVDIAIEGLSIAEAAYRAGYDHVSNFISAFKRQFNVTPASLLKTHIKR